MCSYEIFTDCGNRSYNEDYAGACRNGEAFCFALADGLGGHGGGDIASKVTVEYILEQFGAGGEVSAEYMAECFEGAQQALLKEQARRGCITQMKTTMVLLFADKNRVVWGHIGDSRLYRFQNRRLAGRTLDHSVPQLLVQAGELREDEIRGHADRNRLLRVMGSRWEEPEYEIAGVQERTKKEAYLLCTDGFWEWIVEKNMQSALRWARTPAAWIEKMAKEVRKNGASANMDNYTAIAVFLD